MPGSFSSSSSSNAPYSKYLKLGFGSDRVRVCRGVDRSDAIDETLSKTFSDRPSPCSPLAEFIRTFFSAPSSGDLSTHFTGLVTAALGRGGKGGDVGGSDVPGGGKRGDGADGSDPRLSASISPRSDDTASTAALNCFVRRRLLANASASRALRALTSADWPMDGVVSSNEVHPGAAPWPCPANAAGGVPSKLAHPPSSPASEFANDPTVIPASEFTNEPTVISASTSSPSTTPPVSTRRSARATRSAAAGLSLGSTLSSSEMSRTTPALLPWPFGSEYVPFNAAIFASAPNGSLWKHSWYRRHPNAHASAGLPMAPHRNTSHISGALYVGVVFFPTSVSALALSVGVFIAISPTMTLPKSQSFQSPSGARSTFSGFTSR